MLEITEADIKKRLAFDNPWWERGAVDRRFRDWPRRAYFEPFLALIAEDRPHRAVVLMGPRRVGKTVMLLQAIQRLIETPVSPTQILYVSVDTPTYTGIPLEKFLTLFMDSHGHGREDALYVFFDEVQYLKDWERHLKSLTDSFPAVRFVASGSAAAALKMKSAESGAGRFTDFLLPPLNFAEFLTFRGDDIDVEALNIRDPDSVTKLNDALMDYINFGGFPEAVIDQTVRDNMDRYVANDIIDKVLLRDIPSLYGIRDPQELKRFFATIAFNSGAELSYDGLSKSSGIAKNTIRKYLDYLEAAFLIRRLHRIDGSARRMKRVVNFKVYLTNPTIRSALFGPIDPDDSAMGLIAETACVSQIVQHGILPTHYYARWGDGEVDLVELDAVSLKPTFATEIKWSDRALDNPARELRSLIAFCKKVGLTDAFVLTRSKPNEFTDKDINLSFIPVSLFCLFVSQKLSSYLLERGFNLVMVENSFRAIEELRQLSAKKPQS